MRKYLHPKIEEELVQLYNHGLEYYVHLLSFADFYEDDEISTMGVTVKNYRMAFVYNPKFLDQQYSFSLRYLIIHEANHLLWNHTGYKSRGSAIPHNEANMVQDMIINYHIDTYFGDTYLKTGKQEAYKLSSRPVYTKEDFDGPQGLAMTAQGLKVGDESGCRVPQEYIELVKSKKAEMVFEPLYEWLKANNKLQNQPQPFDVHMELDEPTREMLNRIVYEASEKAKVACRGAKHGGVDAILALSLKQPKRDNLRQVRQHCQAIRGSVKFPSYRRPNRKVDMVKGHTKTGHTITVLHDWSGSMDGHHEAVLSAIYKDGYDLKFVGGDTQVGRVFKVTKKEQLKKIPFRGGGGTVLQPLVDFIKSDRALSKAPLVVLTDGETDTLDFSGFKRVLVLTVYDYVPLVCPQPWVKQLKLEQ